MKKSILIVCLSILLLIILSILLNSCATPSRIIKTYTTDSTGKAVKIVQKIYDNDLIYQNPVSVMTYPFWYNYSPYRQLPKIVIPITPRVQVPHYHIHR